MGLMLQFWNSALGRASLENAGEAHRRQENCTAKHNSMAVSFIGPRWLANGTMRSGTRRVDVNLDERLRARGLSLPSSMTPAGNYVPSVRMGDLLFLAGQIARKDGQILWPGLLGAGVSISQGKIAAECAVLNALAVILEVTGDLDRVVRVLRMTVYVASSPGFVDQAQVADGASDLLVDLLGESGRHARSAVGVAALPLGSPVELELTIQVA